MAVWPEPRPLRERLLEQAARSATSSNRLLTRAAPASPRFSNSLRLNLVPLQGFNRSQGRLLCEGVSLEQIAQEVGTPTYVYSGSAIVENYRAYRSALSELHAEVAYSVKANGSLGILALLAKEGAGFDIVSGGELYRVLRAGGDPAKVVFSGVGKTRAEMDYALKSGIGSFNCESAGELEALRQAAIDAGLSPKVALRVNPDIDADTHPYIATGLKAHKFGIPMDEAEDLYRRADEFAPLQLVGVDCHIGSQIFDIEAFGGALDKVLALIDRLDGSITSVDLGGGLGVPYDDSRKPPSIADYGRLLTNALKGRDLLVMLEPGRSIVARAGVLLTETLYIKQDDQKSFVIVDAAMTDLIRPALYQADHEVYHVVERSRPEIVADVVGPVCESGDFLAQDRVMPAAEPGDLLAVATAGAYGFVLASNYNARRRPAEILVQGNEWTEIRRRESYEDLVRGEREV